MKRSILIAAAAAFALSACGSTDEASKPADKAKVEAQKKAVPTTKTIQPKTEAQIKVEQQKVQQTVEQAMTEIPPELREKHQAAFNCTIEKNNRLPAGQQKQIGVDTIKSINAALKANPNASPC